MKYFKYRTSWRITAAISSVTLVLLLLATQIDNDILATVVVAVALVGGFAAFRMTQEPINRQDER